MKIKLIKSLLILIFCSTTLHSEELSPVELGFFLGASNPVPGSDAARVLNSSLGMGMFGRIQWPWILYTEIGANYTTYLSNSERRLTTVPVYGTLGYKLPLDLPISIFLKAGGGYSYTVARPANTAKWDPMSVLGTEFSFVAGKKVRIGIRLDYQRIYETIGTEKPLEYQLYTSPYEQDTRLSDPYYYKLKNADFFHFNLMLTFLL